MVAQAYVYMLNCKGDGPLLKSVVAAVALLETLHTAFIIHIIYTYAIEDFGNLEATGAITWSTAVCSRSIIRVFMLLIVQLPDTVLRSDRNAGRRSGTRVLYFSNMDQYGSISPMPHNTILKSCCAVSGGSLVLTIVTSILLFARVTFGLGTSALLIKFKFYSTFRAQFGPLVTFTCGLSLAVAVDVLIAAILVYYLIRDKPGFKATENVVRTLVVYFVNTGVITMLVSIIILIFFFVFKESLIFGGMVLIASKLYSNSFLGTLNARQMLRRKTQADVHSSELSTFRAGTRHDTTHPPDIESFGFRHTQKTFDSEVSMTSAPTVGEERRFEKSRLTDDSL
ncbi:unnamed protein product [Somion occarium]|uniref:DUF6534 domain-containing protein n=1 Tax=Somion occarium TaxID=3059160 RepID=A0ABP1D6Z0_9APHY